MSQLGMGVMINALCGDNGFSEYVKPQIGKEIEKVSIDAESNKLILEFKEGEKIAIYDDGQSCCESRYMNSDDDLSYFSNSTLLDVDLKEGEEVEEDYEVKESQFLEIKTSKGVFTVANYNEHNGYYGGFWLKAGTISE